MNFIKKKKEIIKNTLNMDSVGRTINFYVESGFLDSIIKELNDDESIPNVLVLENTKKGYLTSIQQFCEILAHLQRSFDKSFPAIYEKEKYFEMLIRDKIPEFLLSKKYIGDADNVSYYKLEVEKFFTENMYANIKLIYSDYKCLFKKLKIQENMTLDDYDNVHNLFIFMKELVWCNYDKPQLEYVFSTLLDGLKIVTKGKSKAEISEIEKNYIN